MCQLTHEDSHIFPHTHNPFLMFMMIKTMICDPGITGYSSRRIKPNHRAIHLVTAAIKSAKRQKYAGSKAKYQTLTVVVEPDASDAWRLDPIVQLIKDGSVRTHLALLFPFVSLRSSPLSSPPPTGRNHPNRYIPCPHLRSRMPPGCATPLPTQRCLSIKKTQYTVSKFPRHLHLHPRVPSI